MFSATKFVVAGVIVALFGGFLLAGVLTQQRDAEMEPAAASAAPSAAPDASPKELPPGAMGDVVRPGIVRLTDDGQGHPLGEVRHIDLSPNGRVWVATHAGDVFEFGAPGHFGPEDYGLPVAPKEFLSLSDGTLVSYDDEQLTFFDGEVWREPAGLEGLRISEIRHVLAAQDGAMWIALSADDERFVYQVARYADGQLSLYTVDDMGMPGDGAAVQSLVETPDGLVWAALDSWDPVHVPLVYFRDGTWSEADPYGDSRPYWTWAMRTEPDGRLTVALNDSGGDDFDFGTWDGTAWRVEPAAPGHGVYQAFTSITAPDGRSWRTSPLTARDGDMETDFAFPEPFSDQVITDIEFGIDGEVWLVLSPQGVALTSQRGPARGLYILDPELAADSAPLRRQIGEGHSTWIALPEFGGDVYAELFAYGDVWYTDIDSIGRTGDEWLTPVFAGEHPFGTGPDPRAAIEDALAPLGEDLAQRAAEAADLGDWED